jgi:aspartate aminotransferase-like enzyme
LLHHSLAEQIEGVEARAIKIESEYGNTPSIDNVKEAFEKNNDLKALYVVSNETSTGASINWLKQAGELASKEGVFFVVDAISNFGGDTMPIDQYKIDICSVGSQKCLASPPGLSMLSISEKAREFIVSNPPKRHYFNLPRYFKYAVKNETPFTPALPLYYALDRSLELILEEGIDQVVERHATCANAFYAGLHEMGLKMFANKEVRSNTVIAIEYPNGIADKEFRARLDADYGVVLAGGFGSYLGKVFRIGSMGVIGRYHVMATLTAIGATLRRMGHEPNVDVALSVSSNLLTKLSSSAR